MSDDERAKALETLRACHVFPGPYTFKLIGDNDGHLLDEALSILASQLPGTEPDVSRRESDKGNHQALTLTLEVPDAETVHSLYTSFKALPAVRMLL